MTTCMCVVTILYINLVRACLCACLICPVVYSEGELLIRKQLWCVWNNKCLSTVSQTHTMHTDLSTLDLEAIMQCNVSSLIRYGVVPDTLCGSG